MQDKILCCILSCFATLTEVCERIRGTILFTLLFDKVIASPPPFVCLNILYKMTIFEEKVNKRVIKLKSLRFFLSTLLRQDNKLCCRTIYSEHSTLIEYNYASFQEQKAEKQSHNTIKGTENYEKWL